MISIVTNSWGVNCSSSGLESTLEQILMRFYKFWVMPTTHEEHAIDNWLR